MRVLRGRAQQMLVHTGQHHDAAMSAIFFRSCHAESRVHGEFASSRKARLSLS